MRKICGNYRVRTIGKVADPMNLDYACKHAYLYIVSVGFAYKLLYPLLRVRPVRCLTRARCILRVRCIVRVRYIMRIRCITFLISFVY